jgi:hypothetical protein
MFMICSVMTGSESPDRLERQLQLLDRLAEAGLEIALAAERQSKAADADLSVIAMAYARVSRAVRMTIALQTRLIDDRKRRAEAEPAPIDPDALAVETHKVRAGRIVLRVIEAEHPDDDDEIDRLIRRAEDLMDDEDVYDDIASLPLGRIVARICDDLGLDPDWSRLAEEAWAKAEIASGVEGSPFPSSPIAPAMAGGGEPCAGQRFGQHANAPSSLRAGAAEEPMVEGENHRRCATTSAHRDSS